MTSDRRAAGTTMPTVPATEPAISATTARVAASTSGTSVMASRLDPGRADRGREVDVQPDPLGVRRGVLVDLRGVPVVGGQVELVEVLAVQRLGAGRGRLGRHRPRRLGRVADDGPGGGAATPADHPPLHRGEVLRLVDQDVRERVVLDPVRGRGPGPAGRGVLALRRGGQLLQVGADVVVELVVVLGARGHVAEGVAQLVEQRHVLHGQRAVAAPRLGEQPLVLRADHALADAGEEVGVTQPARAPRARPAAATTRRRTRGTPGSSASRR